MKPRVTVKHRFDQGSVHAVATNAVKIKQLADGVLVGQVTNSILSVHDGDSTGDSCHVSARKLFFIRAPWNDINRWVSRTGLSRSHRGIRPQLFLDQLVILILKHARILVEGVL